jgi:hypothetical protein
MTKNLNELEDAAKRLLKLLAEPEVGLAMWWGRWGGFG